VELHLHSTIRFHGVVLSWTTLPLVTAVVEIHDIDDKDSVNCGIR
jgi:hypothetical protein